MVKEKNTELSPWVHYFVDLHYLVRYCSSKLTWVYIKEIGQGKYKSIYSPYCQFVNSHDLDMKILPFCYYVTLMLKEKDNDSQLRYCHYAIKVTYYTNSIEGFEERSLY